MRKTKSHEKSFLVHLFVRLSKSWRNCLKELEAPGPSELETQVEQVEDGLRW